MISTYQEIVYQKELCNMGNIKIGDRVAEMDSYYVGTVLKVFDNACVVEFDAHGRYLELKDRTEYKYYTGFAGVQLAKPYQEFHNAVGMMRDNVSTVFPKNPYR